MVFWQPVIAARLSNEQATLLAGQRLSTVGHGMDGKMGVVGVPLSGVDAWPREGRMPLGVLPCAGEAGVDTIEFNNDDHATHHSAASRPSSFSTVLPFPSGCRVRCMLLDFLRTTVPSALRGCLPPSSSRVRGRCVRRPMSVGKVPGGY